MKKLIAMLLTAVLVFGVCATAQAEFFATVYNTESLNIRSGPGSAYTWLGSVQRDGQVRVIGESGNWYQIVTMDGRITGYMSKNYLRPAGNTPQQSGSFAVVRDTESLNVRSGPGENYNWLASVKRGEWVHEIGESGNWYQVQLIDNNTTGYMSKNFLTVAGSGTSGSIAVVQNPAGTRFLNLRAQPSYTAEVLDIFYNGEVCTVLSMQTDGWVYVTAVKNGQTLRGYFRTEYLSFTGGSAESATVNTSVNGGTGGSLNLRSAPSTNASVVRQIPNGASVSVLLKGNSWWAISYGGDSGFASASFLGGGSGGNVPVSGNAVVQTGNSGRLNLREQPNSNAKILGRYENGTMVSVLQRGTAWCYVQVAGQTGYMMTKYLSLSGSTSTKTVYNPNGGTYVNLRSSPEKQNYNVNVRVPVGAVVNLLSWGDEWSQVSYGGTTGYMMSWFLR